MVIPLMGRRNLTSQSQKITSQSQNLNHHQCFVRLIIIMQSCDIVSKKEYEEMREKMKKEHNESLLDCAQKEVEKTQVQMNYAVGDEDYF